MSRAAGGRARVLRVWICVVLGYLLPRRCWPSWSPGCADDVPGRRCLIPPVVPAVGGPPPARAGGAVARSAAAMRATSGASATAMASLDAAGRQSAVEA